MKKYDVALSFAGEERKYVDEFARLLRTSKVKVFYDDFEIHNLWGKDLFQHLSNVYKNESEFVIIFISENYAKKAWPRLELQAAQAEIFNRLKTDFNSEYVLPVNFDSSELPGIHNTVHHINANQVSPEKLCQIFLQKLDRDTINDQIIQEHTRFREFIDQNLDDWLIPHNFSSFSIDSCLTINLPFEIQNPWQASDVIVNVRRNKFFFNQSRETEYEQYFQENFFEKGFYNDGLKFSVVKTPLSFSDQPTSRIEVLQTRYSQVQFFKDNLYSHPEVINTIESCKNGREIEFPHSLCLHSIVITKDQKILITKRSEQVRYYAGAWSISVEEQMSPDDISEDPYKPCLNLFKRLLKEELDITTNFYNDDELLILSLFLETDINNISFSGVAKLNIDSNQLEKILVSQKRSDKEFTSWKLLTYDELLKAISLGYFENEPDITWHPTSKYRLHMLLLTENGFDQYLNVLKFRES